MSNNLKNALRVVSPVSNTEMCLAAVHNGVHEIYIGMPGFNARSRACDPDFSTLDEVTRFCHLYGTAVNVAFNILVFENELDSALESFLKACSYGPDAFIIQDIGLATLLKTAAPQVTLHASTQMTIAGPEALACLQETGISRFILARELSLDQIKATHSATGAELEVFCHGALCFSYSGQCLASWNIGGRSANRGECAQPCRLPWEICIDGVQASSTREQHLTSPRDLCMLDDLSALQKSGTQYLKVEGRLKSPEYVAATAGSYSGQAQLQPEDLAILFSREFSRGWSSNSGYAGMINPLFSNHHGLYLGEVVTVSGQGIIIKSHRPVNRGEGLVFHDKANGSECGACVYHSLPGKKRGEWLLEFENEFDLCQIKPGMRAYLNSSPSLEKDLKRTWLDKSLQKKVPLNFKVTGRKDAALELILEDPEGRQAFSRSTALLSEARNAPLSEDTIREELSALGNTPFEAARVDIKIEGSLFLHRRELKEMRRAAVAGLSDQRGKGIRLEVKDRRQIEQWRSGRREIRPAAPAAENFELSVLLRSREQLEGIRGLPLENVILDLPGGNIKDTMSAVRQMGFRVSAATPRVLKAGESQALLDLAQLKPDSILVRNPGSLYCLRQSGIPLSGDYSLNIANSLSAAWAFEQGLQRISPALELSKDLLLSLAAASAPAYFEIPIYFHTPAFHTEYCFFSSHCGTGRRFPECGRPCETHQLELRQEKAGTFPISADSQCRNTAFSGSCRQSFTWLPELAQAGMRLFRMEFLGESPQEIHELCQRYLSIFSQQKAAQNIK